MYYELKQIVVHILMFLLAKNAYFMIFSAYFDCIFRYYKCVYITIVLAA